MTLHAGLMTRMVEDNGPLDGNFEFGLEFSALSQYQPDDAFWTGIGPSIRYYFATGTRLVPYMEAVCGAGVTDIGRPDLGGHFQFMPQAGAGMQYFFTSQWSAMVGYRFVHISNAGSRNPNRGVNANGIVAGISWNF
jgi:hypothetical protein